MPNPLSRALPLVRLFTHLLVGTLLGIAAVTAFTAGPNWPALGATTLVALTYTAGLGGWTKRHPELVPYWGALLSAAWLLMVVVTPMGVWLAFPLFFVALSVLPLRWGLPVVALLTAVAIGGFAWHSGGWSIGAVLGPVIGALVAVAIVAGIHTATDESARRGRLEERERFSREIHDTLAQGLGSIHLLLGAAEGHLHTAPEKARTLITQARSVASANLDEARRLVRAQGPSDLAERSLPEALQRLVDRVSDVDTTVRLSGEPVALPGTHDVALLRIAQEALGNAVRHSGAQHIHLTLTYHPDEVLLDVVDDGSGAVRDGVGFGLDSMRARAKELGGTTFIEPTPGQGTAIAVRLPLQGRPGEAP